MTTKIKEQKLIKLYIDIFNNTSTEFFTHPYKSEDQLRPSRLHYNSEYGCNYSEYFKEKYKKSKNPDEFNDSEELIDSHNKNQKIEIGTLWTSFEKTIFFHCLERYSIHRIDDWCHKLEKKSKFEILTYYAILKKNLDRMLKENKIALMSRDEIPIAYEMDENYIELEEQISRIIPDKESHQKVIVMNPIKQKRITKEQKDKITDESTNNEDLLVNFENWNKRWLDIYANSGDDNLTDILIQKNNNTKPLVITEKIYTEFQKIIYNYIKEVLYFIIIRKYDKRSIKVRDEEANEEGKNNDLIIKHKDGKYPIVIDKSDIEESIMTLLFNGKIKMNSIAENILNLSKKFDIEIDKDDNSNLFIYNSILQTMKPSLINNSLIPLPIPLTNNYDNETINESTRESNITTIEFGLTNLNKKIIKHKLRKRRENSQDTIESDEEFYYHIIDEEIEEDNIDSYTNRKSNNTNKKRKFNTFVVDDKNDRINNPLEYIMCDWENNKLNNQDLKESQIHQSTLLHYLYSLTQEGEASGEASTTDTETGSDTENENDDMNEIKIQRYEIISDQEDNENENENENENDTNTFEYNESTDNYDYQPFTDKCPLPITRSQLKHFLSCNK